MSGCNEQSTNRDSAPSAKTNVGTWKEDLISQERLKEILHYNPETGVFTWRVNPANCVKANSVAGTRSPYGYVMISIKRVLYQSHRLAWLYMMGVFPRLYIDHINGVRDDNRWSNIREATALQNARNAQTKKTSTSGVKGIQRSGNKWRATIYTRGQIFRLGTFSTLDEANAAYKEISDQMFGVYTFKEENKHEVYPCNHR